MKKKRIRGSGLFYAEVSKIYRLMKLICLFMFVALLQVSASSYSQITKLDIFGQNLTLEEVFGEIESQSEFSFIYNLKQIDLSKKVNADFSGETLDEILNEILKGTDITYSVNNRLIVVYRDGANVDLNTSGILQESVSGKITDKDGTPLPGVTIVVKGTTKGTVSDFEGNYSVNGVSPDAVLVFSFVGMKTQEISVGEKTQIDVTMADDAIGLDEVVAIGYGVARKSDLTGSVSVLPVGNIERKPVIRVEDALSGQASGVQVQKPNGAPGSGIKVRIRGANSINGSNNPLYVIDGFIGGDIASLNPNEIESMTILKDASSTAIYGSRGSNGVVLITTKSAKRGEAKIEFDAFYSHDQISKKYDLLGPVDYMETVNDRLVALGMDPQFTSSEIDEVAANGGTDWQDEVFRSGATQNYQLSFKGGTEKTQYYLSGSIADQKGIVLNSSYKRYGLRTNINSKLRENFDLAFTMYSTYEEKRNNYNHDGRGNASGAALIYSPNIPVWDDETNNYSQSPSYGPIASNPVFSAKEILHDSKQFKSLANLHLNYEIIEGLTLSVSGGAKAYIYSNPFLKKAGPGTPESNSEAGYNNSYSWNLQNTNMITYKKQINEKHDLNFSAVYEQQINKTRANGSWATGFPTLALGYNSIQLGSTATVSSGYEDWSIESYLGRFNYTYNQKYFFTATFRADGSSKFYGDNKFGYFPSGAFAWRMSDEPFLKDVETIQNLKFRASYGVTGSQAISPYKTLSLLALGQNYSFDGTTNLSIGIGPGVAANPDLRWETTSQTNVGVDLGLFKGRLSGNIDYYYKKTTDLLLDVNIPDYSGGGKITQNVGSLENKGFEFLLTGVLVDDAKFKLSTSYNMSFNRNKILDLGAEEEIFTDGGYSVSSYSAPPFILKVGEPLGQFRGYKFLGLWQENEAVQAAEYGLVPGDSKYLDLNDNKNYDGEDMVNIGSSQPDFIWGWNTNLSYGNFDLSVFVNGVHGNQVWNQTRWLTIGMGTDVESPTSVDILNRWTPANTNTTVPGFSATNTTYAQSSQFVEDGSFIRLNNVTLGYTFPERILNNKLSDVRMYVSAQNLFVITNYSGIDPELTSTPSWSDTAQGIDNGTYPSTRTFTFGIKVGL